jgi:hypothetical protein
MKNVYRNKLRHAIPMVAVASALACSMTVDPGPLDKGETKTPAKNTTNGGSASPAGSGGSASGDSGSETGGGSAAPRPGTPVPPSNPPSTKADGGTPSPGGTADAGTGGGRVDASTPQPPPPSKGDAAVCKAKTTIMACSECCYEQFSKGADIVDESYAACVCVTPGKCKAACAKSLCAVTPVEEDLACTKCTFPNAGGGGGGIDDGPGASCQDAAFALCDKDPTCKAWRACDVDACGGKTD